MEYSKAGNVLMKADFQAPFPKILDTIVLDWDLNIYDFSKP